MMRCMLCGCAAHTRSSVEMSVTTKERYYQCTNINCGHTFISHETFVRSIVQPKLVEMVKPHATSSGQAALAL
ncbi:ogr/Delta-like zinc finger family protein [Plesiomonas shigelloides]|uniref:Prophage P2 OGR-like protein n=1 Tax=Plesiomonas shigelloides 302-73 TaxID=1315976 RepID=R8AN91_PLESH|nr:ogr/Delta-like zinc finger family protein [Plesiomonas shigelloides]EON87802.1 prophage P2 OGR-like protein [Plesiomonas shigelloides 302-73]